jgi:hypothetical protein
MTVRVGRNIFFGVTAFLAAGLGTVWFLMFQPVPDFGPSLTERLSADPARLEMHVRALTESFPSRSGEDPARLDSVASYIREQFEASGAVVEDQIFVLDGVKYRNIVARFARKNLAFEPPLVIGAHYDTVVGTPGADDNASGVAGLIELSRLLGEFPPALPVELVAWTLEEPPFFGTEDMGSAVYAGLAAESDRLPRLVISLEMIGYFSDKPGSQIFPNVLMRLFYPSEGNFLMVAGRISDTMTIRKIKASLRRHTYLPIYSLAVPEGTFGEDLSDHRNFRSHNVPAIMLTDTAFFRNTEYHKAGDTPDRLDYRRMAQVVQAVHGLIREESSR